MNEIKLSKMILRNFKGAKEFVLNTNGYTTVSVFGENGTGKTTLFDAFLWVLFDKDSTNRKDFSVKPQDKGGNDIHFLETEVELQLLVNGQLKIFRKILTEKWTKKRGEATKEFTGHETSYWIDTVPVKAKEYTLAISSIIDETAFKLLTNPFYFNTQLKWEDRRKTLMEICGDVTDAEVIASDKSLFELTDILSGKSINDQKKIITERIKRLNHDIESIPIKINELSRTLLDEPVDYTAIEKELEGHKLNLSSIEQEMTNASGLVAAYRKKQQEAFKIQNEMEARKRDLDAQAGAGLKNIVVEKAKLENEKYRLGVDNQSFNGRIQLNKNSVAEMDKKLSSLREDWNVENAKMFQEPDPDNFICPTCKQSLPEDKQEEKLTQMRNNFELTKVANIEKINVEGKGLQSKKIGLLEENSKIDNQLTDNEARITLINERIAELDNIIESEKSQASTLDYDGDNQYLSLKSQLQAIQDELNKPIEDTTSDLIRRKNEVNEQINYLNKILNNRDVFEKTKARINELKDEERGLSDQLSEMEKQRYLIEQFIKAKVNLLESNINSRFSMVKFKLFDIQINGGISECCEAMVDGVTWPNVNHAGKTNAGIDIINTLSRHYQSTAPIFLDFRESVSRIIDTQSQVINLIKSEPDKTLRVEVA